MAEIGSAFLSILPSAKGFGNKLENEVSSETNGVGKKVGAGFGSALKVGAVAAIGGAFVAASFLKDSLAEAREAQKIGAATNAIIKATGGAANLTAEQVGNLSGALSNKIGVDDEIIQSGANILLTFKSVRDELGKGNDVFTRATAAGADLAAAGFGSIESNAKTLGKALNDPLKGITALTRSGVTFTEQQKEQIKTLVESGDVLGAQKIILGEVEKQVGGVAAASATSGEKAAVAFGNLKEQIGTALLPVVDKLATFFTDRIIPAVSNFVSEMQSGVGTGGTFVAFLKGLYNTLKPVAVFLYGTVVPAILNFFNQIRAGEGAGGGFVAFLKGIYNALKPVGAFIMGTVVPAVKSFVAGMATGTGSGGAFMTFLTGLKNFFVGQLIPAIQSVVAAVRNFVDKALPIAIEFVTGMQARLAPLVPKIQSIFSTIGAIITGVLNAIKVTIDTVLTVIQFVWQNFGTTIMNFVSGAFSAIATIIGGALNIIRGIVQVFTSLLTGDWSGLWDGIKLIVSGAWDIIKGIVSGALNSVKAAMSAAWTVIKAGVSAAWNGIKALISGAVNGVKSDVTAGFNAIKSVVTAVWNAIKSATSSVWDGIKSAISSAINAAKAVVQNQINLIKSAIDGVREVVGKVREIFNDVKEAIRTKLNEAVTFVEKIPGKIKGAFGDPLDLLKQIGKDIVQGLINGISGAATAVGNAVAALVEKIPGPIRKIMGIASPSKVTTELGQFIGDGLAKGIAERKEKVAKAVTDMMQKALDALESKRDKIKSVLEGFKNDFASLSSGIASTFTGNLFEATNRQDFITSLMGKRSELAGLKKAFATLRGYGLGAGFLSQLFASGNGALILELASGGRDDARGIANLFEDTQSLGASLGNQVAKADIGPDIRRQTAVLEDIRADIRELDKRIGRRINDAATAGKKGRVAA